MRLKWGYSDFFRITGMLCASLWILSFKSGFAETSTSDKRSVELTVPVDRAVLPEDTLLFRWRVSGGLDTVIHHYEMTFWSTSRIFRKRIPVIPGPSQREVSYLMPSVRSEFRKHGKYFWYVTAIDSLGHQTQSEARSFFISRPRLSKYLSAWYFPYEIQFGMIHRVHSTSYQAFLNRLTPSTHLDSYGDLSLFFNQYRPFGFPGELRERFYLLSSVGLGSDWGYQFSIYRNEYAAFSPEIRSGVAWFSTGIKQFASLQYHMYVGGSCEILPKSFVTVFGGWLPIYRVRYAETGGKIRTFQGAGSEFGVRFLIPHTMIPVFRIAGIEIDFERIPMQISLGRIRDEYTDVVMNNRCFGIGYLFR